MTQLCGISSTGFIPLCACAQSSRLLLGLSDRDIQVRALQAAQAPIERIRHLLWHGRPAEADRELERFAQHSADIARRNADPEQVVTRDLLRHGF
jgi:hypothetical protein